MNKLTLQKISEYAFLSLPVALITGPLISEICIIIISFFAIYNLFNTRDFNILKNKIILSIFIFYLTIVLSSIISEFRLYSIKTSLPYIRFLLFALGAYYILNSKPEIKKTFLYVLTFCFLILSIGGIYEFFFQKILYWL